MTRMLQSMKHRGPDSTGYALYGPQGTGVLVRYKLADSNSPRDFDYLDRLGRHQAEVQSRMESLGAALEALEADDLIKSAMPGRLYDVFKHYKRDEWERYLAAVTDWEREEYLEVLP